MVRLSALAYQGQAKGRPAPHDISVRAALLTSCSAVAFFVLNCATVINGTNQNVSITSSPERASVEVRRWSNAGPIVFRGVTPANCRLARSADYEIGISLVGYIPETVRISREASAAIAGNYFCGGCLGGGVDLADGAAYDLKPDSVYVTLSKFP